MNSMLGQNQNSHLKFALCKCCDILYVCMYLKMYTVCCLVYMYVCVRDRKRVCVCVGVRVCLCVCVCVCVCV